MTEHTCPTGNHRTPSYLCYSRHGCRCNGCVRAKSERMALDRAGREMPSDHPVLARATVKVPRRPWEMVVRELARLGTTPDEWLWALAEQIERNSTTTHPAQAKEPAHA